MESAKQPQILITEPTTTIPPDVLRGFSISEITRQYGSPGLFFKLEDSLEQNSLNTPDVEFAKHLSFALHADQERTNGHYSDHIMRVTLRIVETFGMTDPDIVAAALLHDSVEDHPLDTIRTLGGNELVPDKYAEALRCLHTALPESVVELIELVTSPVFSNPETKAQEYLEHVKQHILPHPKARVIKLSDFIDNAVGNHFTVGQKQTDLDAKYLPQYRIHMLGLIRHDCLIPEPARSEALDQLTLGRMRAMSRLALRSETE